jgi:hypothetical protein
MYFLEYYKSEIKENKLGWRGDKYTEYPSKNGKVRGLLENVGVNWSILLNSMLKRLCLRSWARVKRRRVRYVPLYS